MNERLQIENWTHHPRKDLNDQSGLPFYRPLFGSPTVMTECGEFCRVDGFWSRFGAVYMLHLSRPNKHARDMETRTANILPASIMRMPEGNLSSDPELDSLLFQQRERALA